MWSKLTSAATKRDSWNEKFASKFTVVVNSNRVKEALP
jgi:hypothetical protein